MDRKLQNNSALKKGTGGQIYSYLLQRAVHNACGANPAEAVRFGKKLCRMQFRVEESVVV